MAAKTFTARKRATARRRTTARGRHPARRVKIPRRGPIHARLGSWLVLRVVVPMVTDHNGVIRSRKDAAILRATHKDCPTCHGNGQIFTKGKDGSFTGSKPCPAKPTKQKVGRWEIYKASRFGADKRTGLVGWSCPCGKKEKPRYRDAKEATKALRTHERAKHGGKSVGGTWYAQAATPAPNPAANTQAIPKQQTSQQGPHTPAPAYKVVTNSGLTDEQWIKQNKTMPVGKALSQGLCWQCSGQGRIYSAFGGQQLVVVCNLCLGMGKAQTAA